MRVIDADSVRGYLPVRSSATRPATDAPFFGENVASSRLSFIDWLYTDIGGGD